MAANDKKAVYEAIRALAARLCKEGEVYLRADLAYELKRFGIADDSIEGAGLRWRLTGISATTRKSGRRLPPTTIVIRSSTSVCWPTCSTTASATARCS